MPTIDELPNYDAEVHEQMVRSIGELRLPTLPQIIRALVDAWMALYGFDYPWKINEGTCINFAIDVTTLWTGSEFEWDDYDKPSHCYVVYKARYYDSECPDGVDDVSELPYFQRLKPMQYKASDMAGSIELPDLGLP